MVYVDHDFAVAGFAQFADDVIQQRLPANRNQRFGKAVGKGAEAGAKAGGNYLSSLLIAREAHRNGFAEGIALNVDGYIAEGSGENVFIVRDNVLYTSPVTSSILPGITRDTILTLARDLGFTVKEELLPRESLYLADEVFFSGTAAEITPIRSVDHCQVGAGCRGPVTEKLQNAFFDYVRGNVADRYGWLTPVSK